MAIHFNKANAKVIKSDFACQRDNLTIRGTEYRPKGNCLPIAVVCHGFMVLWLFRIQSASMLSPWRKWGMFHTALIFAAGV